MLAKPEARVSCAIAVWWVGVVIATTSLFGSIFCRGPIDLAIRTPFDNTRSGHAELWAFLGAATDCIPPGASFTISAPDRETEMNLYMMAVSLLPESRPIPSSYYGLRVERSDEVRFVLEFGMQGIPRPGWRMISPLPGGCLLERRNANP